MCLLAKNKYNADWIINADADEFYYSKAKFNKIFSICNTAAFFVQSFNVLSLNESNWMLNQYVVKENLSDKKMKRLILNNKISKFSQLWNINRKIVVMAPAYIKIGVGNHDCALVNNVSPVFRDDIIIYHFNYRGYKQFIKKVANCKSITTNNRFNSKIGIHWRYFYSIYKYKRKNLYKEYLKVNCSMILKTLEKENVIAKDDSMIKMFKKYKLIS